MNLSSRHTLLKQSDFLHNSTLIPVSAIREWGDTWLGFRSVQASKIQKDPALSSEQEITQNRFTATREIRIHDYQNLKIGMTITVKKASHRRSLCISKQSNVLSNVLLRSSCSLQRIRDTPFLKRHTWRSYCIILYVLHKKHLHNQWRALATYKVVFQKFPWNKLLRQRISNLWLQSTARKLPLTKS